MRDLNVLSRLGLYTGLQILNYPKENISTLISLYIHIPIKLSISY